jgi:hypothetical protein
MWQFIGAILVLTIIMQFGLDILRWTVGTLFAPFYYFGMMLHGLL